MTYYLTCDYLYAHIKFCAPIRTGNSHSVKKKKHILSTFKFTNGLQNALEVHLLSEMLNRILTCSAFSFVSENAVLKQAFKLSCIMRSLLTELPSKFEHQQGLNCFNGCPGHAESAILLTSCSSFLISLFEVQHINLSVLSESVLRGYRTRSVGAATFLF